MTEDRPARKELLPLAGTQWRIVRIVCLPIILACVVVTALQTYFFITSIQSQAGLTSRVRQTAVLIIAVTLLVMIPVFVLVALRVSHRIVGPMRRLEARLGAISEGRIGKGFHFHDGDELLFVADAVVKMEQSLAERLDACRGATTEAELRERLNAFELPADAETDQGAA